MHRDPITGAGPSREDGRNLLREFEAKGYVTPTGVSAQNVRSPLDGRYGRNSAPFLSEPDAYGKRMAFAVSWAGTPDVSGGILSRSQGLNSAELRRTFRGRFDNTDVYRLMYLTLFGTALSSSVGQTAPSQSP